LAEKGAQKTKIETKGAVARFWTNTADRVSRKMRVATPQLDKNLGIRRDSLGVRLRRLQSTNTVGQSPKVLSNFFEVIVRHRGICAHQPDYCPAFFVG